jgi:flavin-dependent dehydrogenase
MRGRRVLLLDKKHFPRRKVCGACLNHSAVTLLDEIGLGNVLRECDGPELTRFEVRAASRRLSLVLPTGRAISRNLFDQRLVESAIDASVTFRGGVTATVGASDNGVRQLVIRDTNNDHDPLLALRDCDLLSSRTRESSVSGEQFGSLTTSATNKSQPLRASLPVLRAKVVLAADGLGNPSLSEVCEIHDRTAKRSRLGAGCEVNRFPPEYESGVIHMAVGRGGYVGLVRVESGALNIAAAFDARLVRETGGPARAAANVLTQAGFPAIPAMADAEWIGTPALTRTTSPVAAERLFVLGDAAGYVEPFTGEGIGWALSSAVAIAPLACAACERWQPSLVAEWSRAHARLVRTRQRLCRGLAALLRYPTAVSVAMTVLPWMPRLLQPIVRGVSLPTHRPLVTGRCG